MEEVKKTGLTFIDTRRLANIAYKDIKNGFVGFGYYLKIIRDEKLWQGQGYDSFNEFLGDEYGKDKSWASRCINLYDKFGIPIEPGELPRLEEQYEVYNVSQLIEMLPMSEELREQVTPDMKIPVIRAMKPKKEKKVATVATPEQEPEPNQEPEPEPPKTEQTQLEKSGKCIHRPEFDCTLEEAHKLIPGTGEDCSRVCCWECVRRGDCELECYSSQRRPAPQLSAYGTPRREYPADSLIATEGCEGGHDCFSCSMECEIRQAERRCVGASCGNPFPCEILMNLDGIREQIGENCEFVNYELAYHRAGDGEPSPCCKHCKNPCEYICEWAMRVLDQEPQQPAAKEQQNEEICCENENQEETAEAENEPSDVDLLRGMLEKEKEFLDEMIKVDKVEPLPPKLLRKKKILVAALAGMLCNLEEPEPEEPKQPALPVLKNNDQRAAFVDAYETWPLWIETEQTGERYYRYDLEDGTSMVVKVYHARIFDGYASGSYEAKYHDGYGRHEYYMLRDGKLFRDCETNRGLLIEKLKEIQKVKKG